MSTNTGNRCISLICKEICPENKEHRIFVQNEERIKEWEELYSNRGIDVWLQLQRATKWNNENIPSKLKTLKGMRRFLDNWLNREIGKLKWQMTPNLAEIKHTNMTDPRNTQEKVAQSAKEFQRTRGVSEAKALEMAKEMWK